MGNVPSVQGLQKRNAVRVAVRWSPWVAAAVLLGAGGDLQAALPIGPTPRLVAPLRSPTAAPVVTIAWDGTAFASQTTRIIYEGGFCAIATCQPTEAFGSATAIKAPIFQGYWHFKVRAVEVSNDLQTRLAVSPYGTLRVVIDRSRPRVVLARIGPRVEEGTVVRQPVIDVQFSEAVRQFAADTVRVCEDACGRGAARLPVIVIAAGSNRATLRVLQTLKPNTRYQVEFVGIADLAGNPARFDRQTRSMAFRTASGSTSRLLFPPSLSRALTPAAGALIGETQPTLRWKRPKGARPFLYNVQVFEGSRKVVSVFPKGESFRVPAGKLRRGHHYFWRVWPFQRSGSFTRRPVGVSEFTVLALAGKD